MAGSAKRYQVFNNICVILVFVIAPWVNMMDIKPSSTWASYGITSPAHLVSLVDKLSYMVPAPSMAKALSPSPMWAVFAYHVKLAALSTAKLPAFSNGTWKCFKPNAATITSGACVFTRILVGALPRTAVFLVADQSCFTDFTESRHDRIAFPLAMTLARAKHVDRVASSSTWCPCKGHATLGTGKRYLLADRINSAFPRAVINTALVSLEFTFALEAGFEHH